MIPPAAPEPAELPADAVEVGRVLDAWGIKGWLKIQPYSASPEAFFSSKRWYLQPPERAAKYVFTGTLLLKIKDARQHGASVVASAHEVQGRDAAEALRGARIFIARSSFPTPQEGEYYWVDLIGLSVVNREGVALGEVVDLMATGPQQVLVLRHEEGGKARERMIPFVDAYIDSVDLDAKRITADWQLDY
ncbi:ribosome maturation factor RimM [Ottowia testudinis]|uniref:Ribosome maturation factor RimM n=1 Tax=Ottowia testudinis TaxID=2816950 RepID=A0A975CL80_9BURK|nr:ribosome maturation factor RimM [Ottowia testudinis]QTD47062.1 ribosome maturation factor RimM [Ottowia testudinis]